MLTMRKRKEKRALVVVDNYNVARLLKAMNMLDKMAHDTDVIVAHGSLLVDDVCVPTFYNAGTESYVIEWPQ